jgi:aldose 1-epimerase
LTPHRSLQTEGISLPGPSAARDRGDLITLTAGDYRAQVSTVGAALESLTVGDRDLVVRSPEQGPTLLSRGAIIAPWPNRIGDGRYVWDGEEIQTALSEPERGNALHGLVSFQVYSPATVTEDELVLRTELFPSPGYPFHLLLTVHYALDAEAGLTTTVTARNLGHRDAPYGTCPHPYLIAGPEPLDEWVLHFEAATVLQVTEDRLLPTGTTALAPADPLSFTSARPIGDQFIDHAYTDLARDSDGQFRLRLTSPSGTGVEMSAGPECGWLQVHTADRPEPENHRVGLAVEPMTCPPDAFRSGIDVVRLAPGDSHEAAWTITGW